MIERLFALFLSLMMALPSLPATPAKEEKPVPETKPAVVQQTKQEETKPAPTEAPKEEKITKSKAKSVAFKKAGVKEANVKNLAVKYELDDGVPQYEVDFRSGDYEYDFTIHAVSGKIIEWDKEYDPVRKPAESKPKETEPAPTEAPKEEKITKSKAKSIALKKAGVSADKIKGYEIEYDVDDGRKVYEISFRSGKYEYDFEINAVTGKIIEWDKEIDD